MALTPAVRKLAALPILIVIATKRDDGSVQLNPVWFDLEDGFIWLNSNTNRIYVSSDDSRWAQRGVFAVLALLVFGFGLGFLARFARGRV